MSNSRWSTSVVTTPDQCPKCHRRASYDYGTQTDLFGATGPMRACRRCGTVFTTTRSGQ